METWFLFILLTAFLAALLKAFLTPKLKPKLPPGPRGVPVISSLIWLRKSWIEIEGTLISLRSKFGPIIRLSMGPFIPPVIFIMDRYLAHQALVQKGAIFADRPKITSTTTSQFSITSAGYGPTWRALRRNLTSHIRKDYSHSRKWVLGILINRLDSSVESPVKVVDHFQFAMFSLLVHMCFGDKLEESKIREVEAIQRQLLVSSTRFQVLNFWPRLTRVLLWTRWKELFNLRKRQQEILIPLIRLCKDIGKDDMKNPISSCYVDTLLSLEVGDADSGNKRKLTEEELVSVCSEFLSAGTDTTMPALQWIMANLVKYPEIQAKLFDEIRDIVGKRAEQVEEKDLTKMPYLKAVVLEGLRRHPPSHFVLPHSVIKDVELGGM